MRACVRLRVEVDHADALACQRQSCGKIHGGSRLADSALLIDYRDCPHGKPCSVLANGSVRATVFREIHPVADASGSPRPRPSCLKSNRTYNHSILSATSPTVDHLKATRLSSAVGCVSALRSLSRTPKTGACPMSTARQKAIQAIATTEYDLNQIDFRTDHLKDLFGVLVFSEEVQKARLPKPVFKALQKTIKQGAQLTDPAVADAVASAMKDWAIEHGATHFTHLFQPMTGLTAEKHDSFLSDRKSVV